MQCISRTLVPVNYLSADIRCWLLCRRFVWKVVELGTVVSCRVSGMWNVNNCMLWLHHSPSNQTQLRLASSCSELQSIETTRHARTRNFNITPHRSLSVYGTVNKCLTGAFILFLGADLVIPCWLQHVNCSITMSVTFAKTLMPDGGIVTVREPSPIPIMENRTGQFVMWYVFLVVCVFEQVNLLCENNVFFVVCASTFKNCPTFV